MLRLRRAPHWPSWRWPWSLLRTVDPERYLRVIAILCGEDRPLWQFLPLAIDVADKAQRLLLLIVALSSGSCVLRGVTLGEGTLQVLLVALVAVDLFSAHRHLNLNMDWKELRATPLLVDSDSLRESHERIFHYQTVASAPQATSRTTPDSRSRTLVPEHRHWRGLAPVL